MKLIHLLLITTLLILNSCGKADPNEQIDEGTVKGEIYESKEIGWSIEIPKGWSVISRDEIEASNKKGLAAIEKSSGKEINTAGLKNLISFQKDQFNMFGSTSEPFAEEFPDHYQQANKEINAVIFQTFMNQGIKADSSSGKEIIDGLEFNAFYTTIYGPDGKVILKQILYSRLINGYDFGVNIDYNNQEGKKALMDAWKKSIFTKKQ